MGSFNSCPPLYLSLIHILKPVEGINRNAAVIYPILSSGDVTGAVVLLEGDGGRQASEVENKAVQIAAEFLGRQMES